MDLLKPLVGCSDEGWHLVRGYMLDAMKGRGPYFVLVVTGEEGSSKTTLCRLVRTLIDPVVKAPLSSLPREEKELGVDGTSEHLLTYDNVSHLPQWLSDCLCRVSTGGGIKSRALYTDDEQHVFDICNPICLNGIPDFAESNDLLSRSLLVNQPYIEKRRGETEINEEFEAVRRQVLGALLDLVSRGLRDFAALKLDKLPRMAESVKWVSACLGDESFLEEYETNRDDAVEIGLEASPIAEAVKLFINDPLKNGEWEGPASLLYEGLKRIVCEKQMNPNSFPKNSKAMSGVLKRDAPALRKIGVQAERRKTNGKKLIKIWLEGPKD